jgi:hypothetical protein
VIDGFAWVFQEMEITIMLLLQLDLSALPPHQPPFTPVVPGLAAKRGDVGACDDCR